MADRVNLHRPTLSRLSRSESAAATQGLTFLHLSASRKHCLRDMLVGLSDKNGSS